MQENNPETSLIHARFVDTILARQAVWGLKKGPTWARRPPPFDRPYYPFWPTRADALRHAQKNNWVGYEPFELSLTDFVLEVLPDLSLEQATVGPNDGSIATPVDASVLLRELEARITQDGITLSVAAPEIFQRSAGSITFPVDAVEPATVALPTVKTHNAIASLLGKQPDSCCDYSDDVLAEVSYHPLLACVHHAFSKHYPLVLSPDMIWLAIAQGFSRHILNHAERLRSKFVAHQYKKRLEVEVMQFVNKSPENNWPEIVAKFSRLIEQEVKLNDLFVCDFSTTGPVERVASQIVMMEAFHKYFDYSVSCICGIPSIKLEGSVDDWIKIRQRVDAIAQYDDLEWWLKHVRPICDHFVRATQGDVDRRHWRRIYKLREIYGGHIMNGWICRLIPYVLLNNNQTPVDRNPLLENDEGISSNMLPHGVSIAPFDVTIAGSVDRFDKEFVGGFVGVTQDTSTLALRPKIGWCVRSVDSMDALLTRINESHLTHEPDLNQIGRESCGELRQFYESTDGAELFQSAEGSLFKILPRAEVKLIANHLEHDSCDLNWRRFCTVSEGGFFAISDSPRLDLQCGKNLWFIIYCPEEFDLHRPFGFKFVSSSFSEFLRMILDTNGRFTGVSGPLHYYPERRREELLAVSYSRTGNAGVKWTRTEFIVDERIGSPSPFATIWNQGHLLQKSGATLIHRIASEPVLMCERHELKDLEHDALALKTFLRDYAIQAPYESKWPEHVDRLLQAIERAKALPNGGVFIG